MVAGTFTTPAPPTGFPASAGLVNAICAVQLNAVGCGFFPNEVTTVCQGFEEQTGAPLQRPGKTVTTAATLAWGPPPGAGGAAGVLRVGPRRQAGATLAGTAAAATLSTATVAARELDRDATQGMHCGIALTEYALDVHRGHHNVIGWDHRAPVLSCVDLRRAERLE